MTAIVFNVFSSFCSRRRKVAMAARKYDPKASMTTSSRSMTALSMVPCVGSNDSKTIGNTKLDRISTMIGNRHMYKFMGSRTMVLASYFNSDTYLLMSAYPLAALSLNWGYTTNLKSVAVRTARYRHPTTTMATLNSPRTTDVIRWLAE